MDVSEKSGTPKSSILMGFLFNHPFWSTPIFGNTHIPNPHWSKKHHIHHDPSIYLQEYTGPKGNCRVLATQWANGLDFSELPGHLRHRAVRLAAEACLVQLLITGFIHADPHEGPGGGWGGGVGWMFGCLGMVGCVRISRINGFFHLLLNLRWNNPLILTIY